jgi:hypothetical protein
MLLPDAYQTEEEVANEASQHQAGSFGCRRGRVWNFRVGSVVAKRRPSRVHRRRTGQGGTTVDTCERRRRSTTNDTARGRWRSGGRSRCCRHRLRPRAGERFICLPLTDSADRAAKSRLRCRAVTLPCWAERNRARSFDRANQRCGTFKRVIPAFEKICPTDAITAHLACGSLSAKPIAFRSNCCDHFVGPQTNTSRHFVDATFPAVRYRHDHSLHRQLHRQPRRCTSADSFSL